MSTPRPTARVLPALASMLVLAGCAGLSRSEPAPAPPASVPTAMVAAEESATAHGPPHLVTISTEVDGPEDRSGLVEIRTTVVGDRRHILFDTPIGPMGEHVVTPGNHWFRLPPTTADALGMPMEWVHIPIDELGPAGIDLPPALADVRAPLPDPATIEVGDPFHGIRTVLAVETVADGAVRLELDDGRTVVVRRSALPAGTTVEPPASAVDIREVDLVDVS